MVLLLVAALWSSLAVASVKDADANLSENTVPEEKVAFYL